MNSNIFLKDKSYEERIVALFKSFKLIQNVSDVDLGKNEFYDDENVFSEEEESSSDED